MKLVYVASASRGNHALLKRVVNVLSDEHFVFAPCLGFSGDETSQVRKKVMEACFWMIKYWATHVVVLHEEVPSQGIWEELVLALNNRIPARVLNFSKTITANTYEGRTFHRIAEVKLWLR